MPALKDNVATPRSGWRQRLAELFVVFAGVMGAFVLSEWQSSRKDADRAFQYVQGILTDLGADSLQLAELSAGCATSAGTMVRFLFVPDHVTVPADSLDRYLRIMATSETFHPRTTTFDVLKSSGDMAIINDLAVQKALIEHYEKYKGVHELDQVASRYWETIQIPYLVDQIDMIRMTFSVRDAYKTTKFKNILAGQISLLQQKAELYGAMRESADSLRARLQSYARELE